MSDGEHSRSKVNNEFCSNAVGGGKCTCATPNSYVDNCKPSPAWDSNDNFWTKNKDKYLASYAPHHIVCVASVGTLIIDAEDKNVPGVVANTRWCVNCEGNMIALPLWGHTIKWYCNLDTAAIDGGIRNPPLFENKPQHDYDHGAYIKELNIELKDVVKELNMQGHETNAGQLLAFMNQKMNEFKGFLEDRGTRGAGTHLEWKNGSGNPNWFLPFSMASTALATLRGYPNLKFDKLIQKKLNALVAILKG